MFIRETGPGVIAYNGQENYFSHDINSLSDVISQTREASGFPPSALAGQNLTVRRSILFHK